VAWKENQVSPGSFIGVTPLIIDGDLSVDRQALTVVSSALLKRNALLFDRIGIIDLEAALQQLHGRALKNAIATTDLEWLASQDVVFETPKVTSKDISTYTQLSVKAELPEEVIGAVERIRHLMGQMEDALCSHNFEKVVFLKGEERKAREHLKALLAKHNLDEASLLAVKEDDDSLPPAAFGALLNPSLHELARDQAEVKTVASLIFATDLLSRLVSLKVRSATKSDTVSLFPVFDIVTPVLKTANESRSDNIISVVLDAMPIPDESTSWERILEFRQDADSRKKLIALRRWMRGVVKDSRSVTELTEELQHLIHEYEESLRFHKMKINLATVESIATATGDLPHELIKLKFSSLLKPFTIIGQRRAQLFEAEMTATGREVAYISKARKAFSDT
jgi:hypothetical protein